MGLKTRFSKLVLGPPRDVRQGSLRRKLSLGAFLAWVCLGADGLSSSAYGPGQGFQSLGRHTYLALPLALLTAFTVIIISAAYAQVVEQFPSGGGGYVVATKLLGKYAGVVSGGALVVDYVLTVTISVAAAGDALLSFLPPSWASWKVPGEIAVIGILAFLNLRDLRESVLLLLPLFLFFIATHAVLVGAGLIGHAGTISQMIGTAEGGFRSGLGALGTLGLLGLLAHAYSLGAGTYTGIEAASNGVVLMREPRVRTARKTMVLMAASLAAVASGLLVSYLLWAVAPAPGKTLDAILAERVFAGFPLAPALVVATLISEGVILIVAAQTGFTDGPRVLANLALDSWLPRRLATLSGRLTAKNGILLMGAASAAALLYTHGSVGRIVIMYSINVFITFTLTMLGMLRLALSKGSRLRHRIPKACLFAVGLVLCATILAVTSVEKFVEGGWVTLAVTGGLLALCLGVRRHYDRVDRRLRKLLKELESVPRRERPAEGEPHPSSPVAVILVSKYDGMGVHTFLGALKAFPRYFGGAIFVSVGLVDWRKFRENQEAPEVEAEVERDLRRYVELARSLGLPAAWRSGLGTDVESSAERLCAQVSGKYPHSTFFAGRVVPARDHWFHRYLHHEVAFGLLRHMEHQGRTVVVIPALVG